MYTMSWNDNKHIQDVHEIHDITSMMNMINEQIHDVLFISSTGANTNTHRYWGEIAMYPKVTQTGTYEFFIQNTKTQETVPFTPHDCLLLPQGYVTYDGKVYMLYDDQGNLQHLYKPKGQDIQNKN